VVADLHEDQAAVGEEVAGDGQAVAQIGQVGVDAVAPGVAEGFDLLGLAGDVVLVAVLDVAARRRPLEIRIEADAVGRVDVDALHLAAQPLALGEARAALCSAAADRRSGPSGAPSPGCRAAAPRLRFPALACASLSFPDEGRSYELGGAGLAARRRAASVSMTASARRSSFSSGTGGASSDG